MSESGMHLRQETCGGKQIGHICPNEGDACRYPRCVHTTHEQSPNIEAIAVNLVRLTGIDKHEAREIARIAVANPVQDPFSRARTLLGEVAQGVKL